jgi:membrane protein required for colicin V production
VAVLDWIAVTLVAVSLLLGLMRGLAFEVVLLAGWVVAFLCAEWLADDVGRLLPGEPTETWHFAGGFVLVFVVVAFGGGLVAALTRKLVTAIGLRPVDRVLGGVFGLARSAVALLVAAVVVHLLALSDSVWWRESRSAVVLDTALQGLKPSLPEKLASYLP